MKNTIMGYKSKIGYMNIPAPYADEMISGYLERIVENNAPSGVSLDEFLLSSGVWERQEILKADGLSKGMFDVVDIRGIEPVMQMTTLPVLIPLMSRGQESRHVRSTCSLRHGNTVLSSRPASVVDHLRHCPLCDAEAPYVRTWHCIPGVTVCAKHNVPLVEHMTNPAGDVLQNELTPGPMALEYAAFTKALWEAGPKFFMQETFPALKARIAAYEQKTGRHFLTQLESMGLTRASAGIAYAIKYIEQSDNELPFEETLTALMVLYGTTDALIADVAAEFSRERFLKAIKGRFELLSEYDERIVRLRCLDCGNEFPSTPHAILTGWRCPVEDAGLTDQELFMQLFDAVNDGYRLTGEYRDFQHAITVKELATGIVKQIKPDRFVNFPHAGMIGKELLPFETIRKEVEKDGKYVLNAVRRYSGISIDVTHRACGKRYVLSLRRFRRGSGCQFCNSVSAKKTQRTYGPRKSRKEDTDRIKDAIAAFGDEPFFLDDFAFINDKRTVASIVNYMFHGGTLRRLGSGVYCTAAASPSFTEILDTKFVVRHGERRGFRLLNGSVADDGIPTVVTMTPDRAHNTDIYNLCDRKVRVIKSHVPVTEDNWKALAVLFTLRHERMDSRKEEALSEWMNHMDIGFADLVRYREYFTGRVFNDAVKLLGRVA